MNTYLVEYSTQFESFYVNVSEKEFNDLVSSISKIYPIKKIESHIGDISCIKYGYLKYEDMYPIGKVLLYDHQEFL